MTRSCCGSILQLRPEAANERSLLASEQPRGNDCPREGNRLPFVAVDRQLVKFRTGAKRFRVGSLWPAPAARCEDDRPVLAPAEPGSAPTCASPAPRGSHRL